MDFLSAIAGAHRDRDEAEGRYGYPVTGVVTDVDTKLNRVRARLEWMSSDEQSEWLLPGMPGSMETIANKDDNILVVFHHGDPNRGFYWVFLDSHSTRATEAVPLGNSLAAVVNNLVDVVQKFAIAFNAQVYANGGSPAPFQLTQTLGKVKDANGSPVPSKTGDQVALSGKVKIK